MELMKVYSYLKIDDKKLSYLRSLIYWAGNRMSTVVMCGLTIVCYLTTFVKAGNKLNRSLL
jgi:hypothetical protein